MIIEALLKILKLEGITETFSGYIRSRIELFKYDMRRELARGMARFLALFLLILFANMVLLFLSLALAFKISQSFGWVGGFATVGGVYGLLILLLIAFRGPLAKAFERQFMEMTEKE